MLQEDIVVVQGIESLHTAKASRVQVLHLKMHFVIQASLL